MNGSKLLDFSSKLDFCFRTCSIAENIALHKPSVEWNNVRRIVRSIENLSGNRPEKARDRWYSVEGVIEGGYRPSSAVLVKGMYRVIKRAFMRHRPVPREVHTVDMSERIQVSRLRQILYKEDKNENRIVDCNFCICMKCVNNIRKPIRYAGSTRMNILRLLTKEQEQRENPAD